jgi:hypothetical protein
MFGIYTEYGNVKYGSVRNATVRYGTSSYAYGTGHYARRTVRYTFRNKVEMHKIFEELVHLPRETADALSRFIFDEKYNFMFLDCSTANYTENLIW